MPSIKPGTLQNCSTGKGYQWGVLNSRWLLTRTYGPLEAGRRGPLSEFFLRVDRPAQPVVRDRSGTPSVWWHAETIERLTEVPPVPPHRLGDVDESSGRVVRTGRGSLAGETA